MGLGVFAAAALSAVASIGADEPTPVPPLARSVHAEKPEAGSIEDALHIRKASGTVELREKVASASLKIDLYRDGKKVDSRSQSAGLLPVQATTRARFSVQVIDLDYLPLGGMKKGHCRMLLTLDLGELISSGSSDVPKDVFGGRLNSSGFQPFRPAAGSANEAPLFYMILDIRPDEGGRAVQRSGLSIEEVIRNNSHSDVLVATLVADAPASK
ncbi:hypothetical protein TA3x_003792 [Tundrisphaera sp. TA3]|uniref:hypothetical protein n=1 Tax=Tundrisphaera sp. TA3 TaxID=3435775 RepID=UPI003EBCB19F